MTQPSTRLLIGTTLVVAGVLFGRRSIAALNVEAIVSTDNYSLNSKRFYLTTLGFARVILAISIGAASARPWRSSERRWGWVHGKRTDLGPSRTQVRR